MSDPGGGSNNTKINTQDGFQQVYSTNKRKRTEDLHDNIKKQNVTPKNTRINYPTDNRYREDDEGPEFMVLVATDGDDSRHLGKYHASAISRKLNACQIKYTRMFQTSTNTVKLLFKTPLEANRFLDSPVARNNNWHAYIPANRITREGVVRGLDMSTTKEEILNNCESGDIEIKDAYQLLRKNDKGEWVPSSCWRLVFTGQTLPKRVFIMRLARNVSPYVRPVIKCYKCFKFGHPAKECAETKTVCPRCGGKEHAETECPKPENYCLHCHTTGHDSNNREECPKWIKERKIKTQMATHNIPYSYAKALQNKKAAKPNQKQAIPTAESFPNLPSKAKNHWQPSEDPTTTPSPRTPMPIPAEMFQQFNSLLVNLFNQLSKAICDGQQLHPEAIQREVEKSFVPIPQSGTASPETEDMQDMDITEPQQDIPDKENHLASPNSPAHQSFVHGKDTPYSPKHGENMGRPHSTIPNHKQTNKTLSSNDNHQPHNG